MPKRIVITEEPSVGEAVGSFLLILVCTLGIGIFVIAAIYFIFAPFILCGRLIANWSERNFKKLIFLLIPAFGLVITFYMFLSCSSTPLNGCFVPVFSQGDLTFLGLAICFVASPVYVIESHVGRSDPTYSTMFGKAAYIVALLLGWLSLLGLLYEIGLLVMILLANQLFPAS